MFNQKLDMQAYGNIHAPSPTNSANSSDIYRQCWADLMTNYFLLHYCVYKVFNFRKLGQLTIYVEDTTKGTSMMLQE